LTGAFSLGRVADFAKAERGSITIESLLWLPIFFAFLGIAVDGSVIFSNRSLVLRTLQDANRGLAIGRFDNVNETMQFIRNNLQVCSLGVCPPDVSVVTSVSGSGVITSRVEIPSEMIDAIGLFGMLTGIRVGIEAEHLQEP